MSRPLSYLERFLLDRNPPALFAPVPGLGVVDLTGNEAAATLQGNAAVSSAELAKHVQGALVLDGTGDYATTAAELYANGGVQTFLGLCRLAAMPTSGNMFALIGSQLSANRTAVTIFNEGGVSKMRLLIGAAGDIRWTLTADEIAAIAVGERFAWRVTFDDPGDTATFQINDLPGVAKTVTAQHTASQQLRIGAYSSGTAAMNGSTGFVAAIDDELTDAEWRMLNTIVAYGGPFRTRRRR